MYRALSLAAGYFDHEALGATASISAVTRWRACGRTRGRIVSRLQPSEAGFLDFHHADERGLFLPEAIG